MFDGCTGLKFGALLLPQISSENGDFGACLGFILSALGALSTAIGQKLFKSANFSHSP